MLEIIIGLIAFVIVLSVVVISHEVGHLIMAKKAGILCHEFSVGMGPLIYQIKKNETVYSIRAIPLGGYVAMAGEELEEDSLKDVNEIALDFNDKGFVNLLTLKSEYNSESKKFYKIIKYDIKGTKEALEDELYIEVFDGEKNIRYVVARNAYISDGKKQKLQIAPYDRTFTNKTVGQRFSAVVAGATMNFVLAILIFFSIGLIQGYPNTETTYIQKPIENSPAYIAGLKDGDKIISIQGNEVIKWDDISAVMAQYATSDKFLPTLEFIVERDGEEITVDIATTTTINSIVLQFKTDGSNSEVDGAYPNDKNKKSKAYKAGLREGDVITKINGIDVSSRQQILSILEENDDAKIYEIEVFGKTEVYLIESYSKALLDSQNIPHAKVQVSITPEYSFDIKKLFTQPFVETLDASLLVFRTLGVLFTDNSVGISDLSGPVGIFAIVKDLIKSGILPVMGFAAIISVNLGIIKLLPFPALDGGRLIFIVYEAITKKKPSPKFENTIHTIGFMLLMGLFVVVFINDILRIVGCA